MLNEDAQHNINIINVGFYRCSKITHQPIYHVIKLFVSQYLVK